MSESQKKNIKVYFKNLNTIRFIAALLVIIHHIEQLKSIFHISNYTNNNFIVIIGRLGVILFFVLSGFLISYLLFKELELKGTIDVKKFYIRRILRIWPLYFLIIFLALFILPYIDFFYFPEIVKDIHFKDFIYKLLLFIFFFPNLVLNIYGMIPFCSHTWSIGAEEQFYLIWPILNKRVKNKWILMFSIILIYLIIKRLLFFLPATEYFDILKGFWKSIPIDCMAIGGLFALISYENNVIVNKLRIFLYNKIVQWIVFLTTIFLVANGFKLKNNLEFFHYEFYSILFGILIINFACNEKRIFSMEYKVLNYFGKISYGLYMFHPIIIVFSIKLCQMFKYNSNYILYPLVFLLIILFSSLSYEYFEKFFINKKLKYSDIISGDNTK